MHAIKLPIFKYIISIYSLFRKSGHQKTDKLLFLPMFSCSIFSLHVFSMDVMKILTLKWMICFLVYTKMFADKYFVIFLVYNQNLLLRFEMMNIDLIWLNFLYHERYWKVTLKKNAMFILELILKPICLTFDINKITLLTIMCQAFITPYLSTQKNFWQKN